MNNMPSVVIFFLDCILSFQTEDVSEYQLWVLSGKEDGAYPLIGE